MDARPDAVLEPEVADEAAPALAHPARRVGFVDDDVAVAGGQAGLDALDNVAQRGAIAVHAVDGLDGDKDARVAGAKGRARVAAAEGRQHALEAVEAAVGGRGGDAVVAKGPRGGAAEAHAIVDARVDQLVVDDAVAGLGRAGKEARVGLEARVEEQRGRRAVEGGNVALEGLGGRRVAVEQARAARAERKGAAGGRVGEAGEVGGLDGRVGGEGEVAVGGEVDGAGGGEREAAQAALRVAAGQEGGEDGVERARH